MYRQQITKSNCSQLYLKNSQKLFKKYLCRRSVEIYSKKSVSYFDSLVTLEQCEESRIIRFQKNIDYYGGDIAHREFSFLYSLSEIRIQDI